MAGSSGAAGQARSRGEVTELLLRWQTGHAGALDALLPLVYRELKVLARQHLRHERAAHTLEPTALVHEAFLRLIEQHRVSWRDRAHFFAIAAQCMRRVLVDYARRRIAQKRGGEALIVTLDTGVDVSVPQPAQLVALDDALGTLEEMDPRQARVVELRYFAGLSIEETAVTLGVSPATVKREWTTARLWLLRELSRQQP